KPFITEYSEKAAVGQRALDFDTSPLGTPGLQEWERFYNQLATKLQTVASGGSVKSLRDFIEELERGNPKLTDFLTPLDKLMPERGRVEKALDDARAPFAKLAQEADTGGKAFDQLRSMVAGERTELEKLTETYRAAGKAVLDVHDAMDALR